MTRLFMLAATTVVVLASITPAASQPVCHSKPVKAAGGISILERSAASKARAAWIRKVREKRGLGRDYAVWLRAKDPHYTCHKIARRHQCDAIAVPCKI